MACVRSQGPTKASALALSISQGSAAAPKARSVPMPTVAQLRAELAAVGEKTTGLKDVLAKRLAAACNQHVISM